MLVGSCPWELSGRKLHRKIKKSQAPSEAEGSAVRLNPKQKPLRVNSRIYPKAFLPRPPAGSLETTSFPTALLLAPTPRSGELRTASFPNNKGFGQDLRTHCSALTFVQSFFHSLKASARFEVNE
jgi:hypothetical protein